MYSVVKCRSGLKGGLEAVYCEQVLALWYSASGSWCGLSAAGGEGSKVSIVQLQKRILIERFGQFEIHKMENSYPKHDYQRF